MRLGVNIDHVATVRQARRTFEPDPVRAAVICELAGAHGIVAHLRGDRRHVQDRDIENIRKLISIKFNFEMAPTEEMVGKALCVLPDQATLVPEKREELTTEGGLRVRGNEKQLKGIAWKLQDSGIIVSLFIDPDEDEIKASVQTGAQAVEIHTGRYAEAFLKGDFSEELRKIEDSVAFGRKAGLKVHAGHGLTYQNAGNVANIDGIEELNIGHSIISRGVLLGLERAVRDMLELIKKGSG